MQLDELAGIAGSISRNASFPITSADQLVLAAGGDQATVHGHRASEMRQIPASYFPIESPEDLMAKFSVLVQEAAGEKIEGVQWGKTGSSPGPRGEAGAKAHS